LPVLRRPPGPDGAHLPARERLQALTGILPPSTEAEAAELLELLTLGELEIEGQLVDASNLALLARLERDGVQTRVMYKPIRGERPLWDFPSGTLAYRETASYVVSAAGGWDVVPPTVLRDGPAGRGTVQLWIEGLDGTDDEDVVVPRPEGLVDLLPAGRMEPGWLPVFEAELHNGSPVVVAHADRPDLAAVAVLDIVINNADRKGSHLVLDRQGSLWGFDHGLSFHEEFKLRTVLWGWAGTPLPDVELSRLDALATDLGAPSSNLAQGIDALLAPAEVQALRARVDGLLRRGRFPGPGHRWPAVPWPPL
jgi:uncharacterized repeat protein (TIGR03843 family)